MTPKALYLGLLLLDAIIYSLAITESYEEDASRSYLVLTAKASYSFTTSPKIDFAEISSEPSTSPTAAPTHMENNPNAFSFPTVAPVISENIPVVSPGRPKVTTLLGDASPSSTFVPTSIFYFPTRHPNNVAGNPGADGSPSTIAGGGSGTFTFPTITPSTNACSPAGVATNTPIQFESIQDGLSIQPTATPSTIPSVAPSAAPSQLDISDFGEPSQRPSIDVLEAIQEILGIVPSAAPTIAPTISPIPTKYPSSKPTYSPTKLPSANPSNAPTLDITAKPVIQEELDGFPSIRPSSQDPTLLDNAPVQEGLRTEPSNVPTETPSEPPLQYTPSYWGYPSPSSSSIPSISPTITNNMNEEGPTLTAKPSLSSLHTPIMTPSITSSVEPTSASKGTSELTSEPSQSMAGPSLAPSGTLMPTTNDQNEEITTELTPKPSSATVLETATQAPTIVDESGQGLPLTSKPSSTTIISPTKPPSIASPTGAGDQNEEGVPLTAKPSSTTFKFPTMPPSTISSSGSKAGNEAGISLTSKPTQLMFELPTMPPSSNVPAFSPSDGGEDDIYYASTKPSEPTAAPSGGTLQGQYTVLDLLCQISNMFCSSDSGTS